jgi:23S rRNA (pseudouridine1915-N3)-methyltransferase
MAMKIKIITVGKDDKRVGDLIKDYSDRISRYSGIEWIFIDNDKTIDKEAVKIISKIKDKDFVVALDKGGKEMDTMEFSRFIEKRIMDGARDLVFVIGGSYGLTQEVLSRADLVMSMSKFTLPHELARVLISEAIYRAFSVIKNLPYHH